MKITRTREITVNMGNYESFKTGATVEHDQMTVSELDEILNLALKDDLLWAAENTGTHNSYVLTWNTEKYGGSYA